MLKFISEIDIDIDIDKQHLDLFASKCTIITNEPSSGLVDIWMKGGQNNPYLCFKITEVCNQLIVRIF